MEVKKNFYNIKTYPGLIYIQCFFAWDDKVTKDFLDDVIRIFKKRYQGKSFAFLVNNLEWGLATPSTERLILDFAVSKFTIGITHHAVVVGQSEVKKWQNTNVINEHQKHITKMFETINDAKSWLESFGYQTYHVE
ncbi:MAG: hypothetical protein HUN05_11570 [Desulfobacter sp.]|nr:MAG: hypothetical protein HUN05_11570 [Desulfobacter sp.]